MTTEEKAKAYDEALERAEGIIKYYKECNRDEASIEDLETIFPELAESEDERIKKEILNVFKQLGKDTTLCGRNYDYAKWIAWLEKQGEQKPIIDGILTATNYDKMFQNCKVHKFNIGDWVVRGNTIAQILDIQEQFYVGLDINGKDFTSSRFLNDDKIHLWTIQDAKDGDVLCTYECDEPKIVFILKGTPKKHYALSYHCYYNIMYPHFASDSEKGCLAPNDEDVKPATKEQRDLLFQKMNDAGYEWDADKKKLKKKPQRMISAEAKEALYNKPAWKPSDEQMYMLEWLTTNVLDDGVVGNKAKEVLNTLIEQLKLL